MAVSIMVGTGKKLYSVILVFLKVQDISFWSTLCMMNFEYFYVNVFRFMKKVPSPTNPVDFFSKYLYPNSSTAPPWCF